MVGVVTSAFGVVIFTTPPAVVRDSSFPAASESFALVLARVTLPGSLPSFNWKETIFPSLPLYDDSDNE